MENVHFVLFIQDIYNYMYTFSHDSDVHSCKVSYSSTHFRVSKLMDQCSLKGHTVKSGLMLLYLFYLPGIQRNAECEFR